MGEDKRNKIIEDTENIILGMDKIGEYKPDLICCQHGCYARFLVQIGICPACGNYIAHRPKANWYPTFPSWYALQFDKQAERAGIMIASNVKVDGRNICVSCEKMGMADFLCFICKERKPTDKCHESFGDPPEHLCKDCYETEPAKQWDVIVETLRERHKYDFE